MINRVKKKIKNRAGMTLVEVLCAVLILLLVSQGMASGVQLANEQYAKSIRKSEAEELYLTLETIISTDLRSTTSARTDAATGQVFYRSKRFASGGDDTIFVEDGQIVIGNPSTSNKYNVVDTTSYTKGMSVALDLFTYDDTNKLFKVGLTISQGGKTYATGTFQVRGLSL